ncbi:hypothetical protein B0H17DRAFT_295640 [Mycena rosella]|uniref:Uncharacterized protein n=1 Tax=Mycena rosella TaxID=1033263 RepID=A0AAD7CVD1_MYCRO|nr:hypothetical protein B0H17DRAFT_295640 [Mycena rosella]
MAFSSGGRLVAALRTLLPPHIFFVLTSYALADALLSSPQARRGRARTPTPGRYHGPPKRGDSACFSLAFLVSPPFLVFGSTRLVCACKPKSKSGTIRPNTDVRLWIMGTATVSLRVLFTVVRRAGVRVLVQPAPFLLLCIPPPSPHSLPVDADTFPRF